MRKVEGLVVAALVGLLLVFLLVASGWADTALDNWLLTHRLPPSIMDHWPTPKQMEYFNRQMSLVQEDDPHKGQPEHCSNAKEAKAPHRCECKKSEEACDVEDKECKVYCRANKCYCFHGGCDS